MMNHGSISARMAAGGGGGGGNAFSDAFASDLANWTVDAGAGWSIVSGRLRYAPGTAYTLNLIRYSSTTTGSATQYAKVTMPFYTQAANSLGVMLRCQASSGYRYLVYAYNGTLVWSRITWDLSSETEIDSETMSFTTGNSLGVTIQGTGVNTVVKVWLNPTANTPVNADNWDSASDPADYTLTDGGSLLTTNNANSGQYAGLVSYIDSSSGGYNEYDDFYGGGL